MKLAYIVFKFESFDAEAVFNALLRSGWPGVIVTWNYGGMLKVLQCPSDIKLSRKYHYSRAGTWSGNRFLKWPVLIGLLAWILFRTLSRYKAQRFWVAGGDIILWIAQIFKFFGRIERTVTTIEDWSLQSPRGDLVDRLNNLKTRINDRVLNCLDTQVVVYSEEIFSARNEYWKGKTLRNSVLRDHQWAWFLEPKREIPNTPPGRFICSLGNLRSRFGIELLFDILPELNREHGFKLRIIGPENEAYHSYRKLAGERGLDALIEWKGFVSVEDLPRALQDCFCGVNIQEDEINNGRFVVSGRVVNYLQCVLVPVVSSYSGSLVKCLTEFEMGVVCEPTRESYRSALLQAHVQYPNYIAKIDEFMRKNPYKRDVADFLGL